MANATPSPKDIENALAAKDYQSAKTMTYQVLKEHPMSAKGHLFNAFILAKVDRNPVAANEELKNVTRLDKKGDVKGSALFGRTVAELEATKPRSATTLMKPVSPVSQSYTTPSHAAGSSLFFWLVVAGVIGFLIWLITRNRKEVVTVSTEQRFQPRYTDEDGVRTRQTVDTWNNPTSYRRGERIVHVRETASQPVYQQPVVQQQQGMGALGTAASVAGGVVAGSLIMDAIHGSGHGHGSHHSGGHNDGGHSHDYHNHANGINENYGSREAAPAVDYETERSSFSSGSDDSSWDFGSSSSSSSSGSDWGDSGGSDW